MAQGQPHQIFYPPPEKPDLNNRRDELVFGTHAKRHHITGLPLEMGSGALPPDEQARRIQFPQIAATQGQAAADAMLVKLNGAASAPSSTASTLQKGSI